MDKVFKDTLPRRFITFSTFEKSDISTQRFRPPLFCRDWFTMPNSISNVLCVSVTFLRQGWGQWGEWGSCWSSESSDPRNPGANHSQLWWIVMMNPMDLQLFLYHENTLLRTQDRDSRPPGCWETIKLDFLMIFENNKNLKILVQKKYFSKIFVFRNRGGGGGRGGGKIFLIIFSKSSEKSTMT